VIFLCISRMFGIGGSLAGLELTCHGNTLSEGETLGTFPRRHWLCDGLVSAEVLKHAYLYKWNLVFLKLFRVEG
jgi:hypothetical protein